MTYNPKIHHRRSIRLKGYDYSSEALYFITLCCQDRAHLFGKIEDNKMFLNEAGKMIDAEWVALSGRFNNIILHEYVVMPNHFHGIIQIDNTTVGASQVGAALVDAEGEGVTTRVTPTEISPTAGKTIGDMLDAFKSITTVNYINGVKTKEWEPFNKRIWQRNYYEHIIRNAQAYLNISNHIISNPLKWNKDEYS